jgi:hypothetical protein
MDISMLVSGLIMLGMSAWAFTKGKDGLNGRMMRFFQRVGLATTDLDFYRRQQNIAGIGLAILGTGLVLLALAKAVW